MSSQLQYTYKASIKQGVYLALPPACSINMAIGKPSYNTRSLPLPFENGKGIYLCILWISMSELSQRAEL